MARDEAARCIAAKDAIKALTEQVEGSNPLPPFFFTEIINNSLTNSKFGVQ